MNWSDYAWLGLNGPTTDQQQGITVVEYAERKFGDRIDPDRILQGELQVIGKLLWVPLKNGGIASMPAPKR